MQFDTVKQLQEALIHCSCHSCPFRNEARGYYPKPPRGPDNSNVMIVFENPGSPEGPNTRQHGHPELKYTINTVPLEKALEYCIDGQSAWLFSEVGLDKAKWDEAGFEIGKSVYTTDSVHCPDPKPKSDERDDRKRTAAKAKAHARSNCLAYLREEIRLVNPKVIIAFGDKARASIEELERISWQNINVTKAADERRILEANGRLYAILPHPSWWKREKNIRAKDKKKGTSAASDPGLNEWIEFVFRKANEFVRQRDAERLDTSRISPSTNTATARSPSPP